MRPPTQGVCHPPPAGPAALGGPDGVPTRLLLLLLAPAALLLPGLACTPYLGALLLALHQGQGLGPQYWTWLRPLHRYTATHVRSAFMQVL